MKMLTTVLAGLGLALVLGPSALVAETKPAAPPKITVKMEIHPEVINWGGVTFAWPKRRGEKDYEYKVGDALLVYDVVEALDQETLAQATCTEFSLQHKGATWCFANAKNLAAFKKSIDKDGDSTYEPVFGGRCTLGTSWGIQSPNGDPRTFEVHDYRGDKRLVLQSHNKWKEKFRGNTELNFRFADGYYRVYQTVGAILPNTDLKKASN